MTTIEWDKPKDRRYDIGIDRGVLYPNGSAGVPWNGLVSVDEDASGADVEPLYIDGYKYFDAVANEDFQATLSAFTYPKEFEACLGNVPLANGMFATMQRRQTFGLSWRTKTGNAADGEDGYKIHILYGATAIPATKSNETLGDTPQPVNFQWTITAVPQLPGMDLNDPNSDPNSWVWPEGYGMPGWPMGPDGNTPVPGWRGFPYVIIDSNDVDPAVLENLETHLYGIDHTTPAYLPTLTDVTNILNGHDVPYNYNFDWTDPNPVGPTYYTSLQLVGSSQYIVGDSCPAGRDPANSWISLLTDAVSSSTLLGTVKFDGTTLSIPNTQVVLDYDNNPVQYFTPQRTLNGEALIVLTAPSDTEARDCKVQVFTATDVGTIKQIVVDLPPLPTDMAGGSTTAYKFHWAGLVATTYGNLFAVYASSVSEGGNEWIAHRYRVETNGDVTFIDTSTASLVNTPLGGIYASKFPIPSERTVTVDDNVLYSVGVYGVTSGYGYADVVLDLSANPLAWQFPPSLSNPDLTAVRNGDSLYSYGPWFGKEAFPAKISGKGLTFGYSDGFVIYAWDGSQLTEAETLLASDTPKAPHLELPVGLRNATPRGNLYSAAFNDAWDTAEAVYNPYGGTPQWDIVLALAATSTGVSTPQGTYVDAQGGIEVAEGVMAWTSPSPDNSLMYNYYIPV